MPPWIRSFRRQVSRAAHVPHRLLSVAGALSPLLVACTTVAADPPVAGTMPGPTERSSPASASVRLPEPTFTPANPSIRSSILAGNGGGSLNPGRYLKLSSTPATNLFLGMADRFGVRNLERFGDSTGRLSEI